jgi:hypothetical protein
MSQPQEPGADIFTLSYVRPRPDGVWTGIFIGVYSSLKQVELAKSRLSARPGFRDYPEGLHVSCYRMNEDYDDPTFFTQWDPTT